MNEASDDLDRLEVIGACPLDCPDGCSWVITVDELGAATKIRGNKNHPFAAGSLCPKVNPWLVFAADPTRLRSPLRRSGPKGAGQFVPISSRVKRVQGRRCGYAFPAA